MLSYNIYCYRFLSNNTRVDIEENDIVVEFNNLDVSYNKGEIGFYGILCSNENNANIIKNNYISINDNIYGLNLLQMMQHFFVVLLHLHLSHYNYYKNLIKPL